VKSQTPKHNHGIENRALEWLHGGLGLATDEKPFPWQERLLTEHFAKGLIPDALDIRYWFIEFVSVFSLYFRRRLRDQTERTTHEKTRIPTTWLLDRRLRRLRTDPPTGAASALTHPATRLRRTIGNPSSSLSTTRTIRPAFPSRGGA